MSAMDSSGVRNVVSNMPKLGKSLDQNVFPSHQPIKYPDHNHRAASCDRQLRVVCVMEHDMTVAVSYLSELP